MREMKDSGVEWIGEIPTQWIIQRAKNSFVQKSERGNSESLVLLSPTQNYGVIPQDLYEQLSGLRAVKLSTETDLSSLKTVHKGAYVISLRSFQGGFEYSEYEGVVSPAYQVFYPSVPVSEHYYRYLFKSQAFIDKMNSFTLSLRDGKNIAFSDFARTYIPVPPLDEQYRIANFLSNKCSQVDTLIANVQAQIERLKAYKQSVITEVVTKGLDPTVPMKDSGVEWIPQIPKTWTLSRVGLHYTIILGKMLCPNQPDSSYSLEKYYCAANVHFGKISSDELKEMWFSPVEKELYQIHNGDMLIVEGGAGAGGCAIVQKPTDALVQNSVMIVRKMRGTDNRYLRYWIESMVKRGYLDVACNKATIPHYTKEKLAKTVLPVLPEDEQVQIANYLDEKYSQIDRLIALKQSKIEKLEQYKKSLIYEYVTGKKEVS